MTVPKTTPNGKLSEKIIGFDNSKKTKGFKLDQLIYSKGKTLCESLQVQQY